MPHRLASFSPLEYFCKDFPASTLTIRIGKALFPHRVPLLIELSGKISTFTLFQLHIFKKTTNFYLIKTNKLRF